MRKEIKGKIIEVSSLILIALLFLDIPYGFSQNNILSFNIDNNNIYINGYNINQKLHIDSLCIILKIDQQEYKRKTRKKETSISSKGSKITFYKTTFKSYRTGIRISNFYKHANKQDSLVSEFVYLKDLSINLNKWVINISVNGELNNLDSLSKQSLFWEYFKVNQFLLRKWLLPR